MVQKGISTCVTQKRDRRNHRWLGRGDWSRDMIKIEVTNETASVTKPNIPSFSVSMSLVLQLESKPNDEAVKRHRTAKDRERSYSETQNGRGWRGDRQESKIVLIL